MKSMFFLAISLVACPVAGASAHAEQSRPPVDFTGGPCPRRAVSFYALGPELSRIQLCRGPEVSCRQWASLETREIAGYAQSNWLYSGPSKSFSVAEQDDLLAQAWTRAGTTRPPWRVIRQISYFTDFLTGGGPGYVVGARVTYGRCTG